MSISRIDSGSNHTHGYYVRVSIDGVVHSRFFQDARHGGTEEALRAAQAHDAALIAGRGPSRERRPGRRNTSGVTGVSRGIDGRSGLPFWLATWMDGTGRQRRAHFAVNRYGEEEARRLAIEARLAGLASKGVLPRPSMSELTTRQALRKQEISPQRCYSSEGVETKTDQPASGGKGEPYWQTRIDQTGIERGACRRRATAPRTRRRN